MPARDVYHNAVKRALEKDGWTITHDPYHLSWAKRDMFIDLGAEIIAAESADKRIAVEVKSFLGKSEVSELEKALGQFVLYKTLLERRDKERQLYLAVPERILKNLFEDSLGEPLLEDKTLQLLSFDPEREEITTWLPVRPQT